MEYDIGFDVLTATSYGYGHNRSYSVVTIVTEETGQCSSSEEARTRWLGVRRVSVQERIKLEVGGGLAASQNWFVLKSNELCSPLGRRKKQRKYTSPLFSRKTSHVMSATMQRLISLQNVQAKNAVQSSYAYMFALIVFFLSSASSSEYSYA